MSINKKEFQKVKKLIDMIPKDNKIGVNVSDLNAWTQMYNDLGFAEKVFELKTTYSIMLLDCILPNDELIFILQILCNILKIYDKIIMSNEDKLKEFIYKKLEEEFDFDIENDEDENDEEIEYGLSHEIYKMTSLEEFALLTVKIVNRHIKNEDRQSDMLNLYTIIKNLNRMLSIEDKKLFTNLINIYSKNVYDYLIQSNII